MIHSKHYERVPDDHKCNVCGKSKWETNFKVRVYKENAYVRPICTKCDYSAENPRPRKPRATKPAGETLHWDKISPYHTCFHCGKDKNEVNFKVSMGKSGWVTDRWCNLCVKYRAAWVKENGKVRGTRGNYRDRPLTEQEKINRIPKKIYIRQKIKEYFDEQKQNSSTDR